jgi:hypothetical protein
MADYILNIQPLNYNLLSSCRSADIKIKIYKIITLLDIMCLELDLSP